MVPPDRDLPASRAAAIEELLVETVVRTAPDPRPAPPVPAARPRPVRRAALAAGLGVAVVTAGLWFLPGREPAAAATLRAAARTAAVQPGPAPLAPGEYWYTRSELVVGPAPLPPGEEPGPEHEAAAEPVRRESWTALDGSGRLLEAPQSGPAFWDYAFGPGDEGRVEGVVDSYEELLALPTDPEALAERLADGPDTDDRPAEVEAFANAASLLGEAPAPPALRAALFEVVAAIDGVELLGEVTDPAGRPGTGVALVDEFGVRHELVFDPATAQPLAQREVLAEPSPRYPGQGPGAVLHSTVHLDQGVVPSTDARA